MEMIDGQWIRKRLSGERGEQARLAKALGINNDKMSKTLKGERRVQPQEIPKLLDFFGLQGFGEEIESLAADEVNHLVKIDRLPPFSKLYSVIQPKPGDVGFSSEFLARMTNSDPENLFLHRVDGDTMSPTLANGDMVLVDISQTNLNFDGLFVLDFGGEPAVKRISKSLSADKIQVLSDNAASYPPMEVSRDEVQAIGRVLWYGHQV